MSRRVYTFDSPDTFICGAVGQPGQRTFYLQASKGSQVVSVALEKAQVAILAERLATLLLALRQGGVAVEEGADTAQPRLAEPVVEQFRVGTLTLGWDSDRERVVIEAQELTDDEVAEDPEEEDLEGEEAEEEPAFVASDLADGPDLVRIQLEPNAALEFATGALAVVQAGRPPCPYCGEPLDPTGHFCARRNGHAN
jgi:uncharacterized repeat protein (TIGR03847 family)